MKGHRLFAVVVFVMSTLAVRAQSPEQKALLYADSMVSAYTSGNFEVYSNLSYPGVVSYYGGNRNFREYVERSRAVDLMQHAVSHQLQMVQIEANGNEAQCVVKRSQETVIDNRKAIIISYLVGQSLDGGNTWKFFDVALNSVDNITWIMPDIFSSITIPVRQVVYEKSA